MSELAAAAVRTWWRPTMAELRWMNHDEALKRYRTTLRRATTAQFPATPALSHAATVCAFYAQANLVSEEQARRHLHTAAGRAGIPPREADGVIDRAWNRAVVSSIGERLRGGLEGVRPGAFSAVAAASSTFDHQNNYWIAPNSLDLGPGVLVHLGHDARNQPVAVGVPSRRHGVIHLDAVFASGKPADDCWSLGPGDVWTLLEKGRLRSVSIVAQAQEYHRGVDGRLVRGVLVAVDLVEFPADEAARITSITSFDRMTPGQKETQANLDHYLSDDRNPLGIDLGVRAQRDGVEALAPLAGRRSDEDAGVEVDQAGGIEGRSDGDGWRPATPSRPRPADAPERPVGDRRPRECRAR